MIPIVVVAFNRPRSLARLLGSLSKACYPSDNVPLIISIDRGENNGDVLQVANNFEWTHGEKKVVYQEKNLKLRRHVLKCGDISQEYGGVIVLEDDLYVAPDFYNYAVQAMSFSKKDSRIGGISLYNHLYNVTVFEPFEAIDDGYDNWYFQFASSWGQAWTAEQWLAFRKWYEENEGKDLSGDDIPATVTNWSASSWLKYFIKFLVVTDKYFIYPRKSYTTNFGDSGTHVDSNNTNFQVPLCGEIRDAFHFSKLDEASGVYDSFFENVTLAKHLNLEKSELSVDLYGVKARGTHRYFLTSQKLDCKIIKSFAREMRPVEANVLFDIPGNDFFLYDTQTEAKNAFVSNDLSKLNYNIRVFRKDVYPLLFKQFLKEVKHYVKKKTKK